MATVVVVRGVVSNTAAVAVEEGIEGILGVRSVQRTSYKATTLTLEVDHMLSLPFGERVAAICGFKLGQNKPGERVEFTLPSQGVVASNS